MRTLTKLIVASAIMALSANTAVAHDDSDRSEIKRVMSSYFEALNASNAERVVALYAEDSVFMPPNTQSIVGIDAIRSAYTGTFKNIDLDVEFTIDEIVQLSPTSAFVRTGSNGTITSLATGAKAGREVAGKELFVLQKQSDGNWKIARYAFSSANPVRQ